MATAEPKSTHSQQHQSSEPASLMPEQDHAFFSNQVPETTPFFQSTAFPNVQAKLTGSQKPFFQPARLPMLQRKCAAYAMTERGGQAPFLQRMPAFESEVSEPIQAKRLIQRMPAFESEADAPIQTKIQPKPLIQRQIEPEVEPDEDQPLEADMSQATTMGTAEPPDESNNKTASNSFLTQAKLTIGRPNDAFEREADAVADQIVTKPKSRTDLAPGVQAHPLKKFITRLTPQALPSVKPKQLQRQNDGTDTANNDVESRLSSNRGGGSALDSDTQTEMESSFGADFSKVRIHTGSEAAQLNQELGAKAFTHGSDIYFNQGQYNPSSSGGKHLLAHELTHTVQQGAAIQTKPLINHHTNSQTIQRFSISEIIESVVNKVPGYELIKVILGKSPITGAAVPRTGLNIIKAVLGPAAWYWRYVV